MAALGSVTTDAARTIELLETIEARLARLEAAVARASSASAQLAPIVATAVDTVDAVVARLQASGVDPDERLRMALQAADQLTRPTTLAALDATLTSGLLEPAAVAIVGKLGAALATLGTTPQGRVGVFGLLRALRDPDVQHAVGLMVAFARQFGARISDPPALADPTAAALPSAPDMRER